MTGKPIHLFLIIVSLMLVAASGYISIGEAEDMSPEALLEAGHWKRLRQIVEPRVAGNLPAKDARSAYLLSCVKLAFRDVDGALAMAEQAVALEPGNSS